MATSNLLHFPHQPKSRSKSKEHPKHPCTVLDWVRNGFTFPGQLAPFPVPLPPEPEPESPKTPGEPDKGGA